jgi:hypothetical protein
MGDTIIGLVEDGKFRRLWPKPASMEDVARLTSIQPMQAIPPDNGELDLAAHEGKIIAVRGDDQGSWVYSAEVIDTGGEIAKTLATKVFTKPTEADGPLGGLGNIDHPPLSEEGASDTKASELAIVKNGQIFLWSQPDFPAKLFSDDPWVGRAREPIKIPDGARCGVVTQIGSEGPATLTAIADPLQVLIIEALFDLRRKMK